MERATLDQAAGTLNSTAIHLLRSMREVDDRSGLTPPRLSALSVLHFGGPQTLGRLAAIEGVTPATMSRLVDTLSADGLVTRAPHPDNARMVVVAVTSAGAELMTAAAARRVEVIADALEGMTADEQRTIAGAAEALARLVDRLKAARRDRS